MKSIIKNFKKIASNSITDNTINNCNEFIQKETLLNNIVCKLDKKYFSHNPIYNGDIHNCKISIIMTASNRSKQTYFTLQTISKSSISNIHIVLIDDSTIDKIHEDQLKCYEKLSIDFIEINTSEKCWINPCINYNIGFQYIKCPVIILQNAEVCHIGDVCENVLQNISDNKYLIFDVAVSNSFEQNENIYKINYDFDSFYNYSNWNWYQHYNHNNRMFHFMTAFTKQAFDKLGGFSTDYFSQGSYDDDDFLLKVRALNLNIINIKCDESKCMGIHQFHQPSSSVWERETYINRQIFELKKKYYESHNQYKNIKDFDYADVKLIFQ